MPFSYALLKNDKVSQTVEVVDCGDTKVAILLAIEVVKGTID